MAFCGLPKCPLWFPNVRTKPRDEQDVVASRLPSQASSGRMEGSEPAVLPSAYQLCRQGDVIQENSIEVMYNQHQLIFSKEAGELLLSRVSCRLSLECKAPTFVLEVKYLGRDHYGALFTARQAR